MALKYARFKRSHLRGGGEMYYLFPEDHTGSGGDNPYFVTTSAGEIAKKLVEIGNAGLQPASEYYPDPYTDIVEFEKKQ